MFVMRMHTEVENEEDYTIHLRMCYMYVCLQLKVWPLMIDLFSAHCFGSNFRFQVSTPYECMGLCIKFFEDAS